MLFLGSITLGCTLSTPTFNIQNNCLVTDTNKWFQTVSIRNEEHPGLSYIIVRNRESKGAFELCLDDISPGYFMIQAGDTLARKALTLPEGAVWTICHSGGDRASFCRKASVSGGSLVEIEEK